MSRDIPIPHCPRSGGPVPIESETEPDTPPPHLWEREADNASAEKSRQPEPAAFLQSFYAPLPTDQASLSPLARWKLSLSEHHQRLLAIALFACAVILPATFVWYRIQRGGIVEIDQAAPLQAQFQVDINQAQWPELVVLPGIGPSLATAIVQHRETFGSFQSLDELRAVSGIGDKKLAAITPYLLPLKINGQAAPTHSSNAAEIATSPAN